jgi:hypothetical protein
MKSADFIQRKFQAWAHRKNIMLQGSEGERGQPNYTLNLEENLFGGDLHIKVRSAFEAGAGGELRGEIPSMSALHSSAAMAVNLFQYWIRNEQLQTLAEILNVPSTGIESVSFERKYPVCADWKAHGFHEPPHLDLGIDYIDSRRVGVECKLFEPYGWLEHAPLKRVYLELPDAWSEIPACRELAEELAAGDAGFRRLGPAQLLRHILGLKFGKSIDKVRLVYLYFDSIGDEAEEHRVEIRRFQQLVAPDPIRFIPITVQEFVLRAVNQCRSHHTEYVDYLADRYL